MLLEKSDKFSKTPSSHGVLEYEFVLMHLYSNIGSSFTSGKRDLVYFIPKRAGHLSTLLPLSQVHHGIKLDKECSKPNSKYCASIQLTCIHRLSKLKKTLNFKK
jgi:hypothetical protein